MLKIIERRISRNKSTRRPKRLLSEPLHIAVHIETGPLKWEHEWHKQHRNKNDGTFAWPYSKNPFPNNNDRNRRRR